MIDTCNLTHSYEVIQGWSAGPIMRSNNSYLSSLPKLPPVSVLSFMIVSR